MKTALTAISIVSLILGGLTALTYFLSGALGASMIALAGAFATMTLLLAVQEIIELLEKIEKNTAPIVEKKQTPITAK